VEGPYYLPHAPFRTDIAAPDEGGEQLVIRGVVLEPDCSTPIGGALVEVWQTDANGKYYYRDDGYRLRGQLKAIDDGTYAFRTVRPGRYRIGNGFRPAHIHLKISHPGHETVTTQLYFQGDPYVGPNDACGSGCGSNDPKRIISLREVGQKGYLEGTFPIYLEKK
jgi:protocatechuate 3,4-dioxygenase beta subunit